MKVYWAPLDFTEDTDLTLAYYEPTRLSTNIPVDLKDSAYYRCPAFMETVKNTFVLKSPITIDFKFNTQTQMAEASNDYLFKEKIRLNDATEHGIMQLGFNYLLFSEKPLVVTQLHPYLHHNTFTNNANAVLGEFDCGRWVRPLQAAFILNPKESEFNFNVKRGDIYSYIRFNTKEKIELVNFNVTPTIEKVVNSCLDLKKSGNLKPFSLDFCYNQFIMYRYKQAIMKELKAQGL
jgi:hypothetical protein